MVKYVLRILAMAVALWVFAGLVYGALLAIAVYSYGLALYPLALVGLVWLTWALAQASLGACRRIRTLR